MCGIVATVGIRPSVMSARGGEALQVIAHRGPDDEGSWTDGHAWLGTRRLAIIDLSPGGHQPMVHAPSGVVITFNGEIYNYLELRAELERKHDFRTRSDTEVLLAAYLAWGEGCLDHLNGMWSFVVWDPRHQKAFFARDRLGVKPFYFSRVEGGLSVASEPKALIALHPGLRRVDDAALYGFLAAGQIASSDRSFYSGIQTLPPGHCGTFSPGDSAPTIRRYWAPPPPSQDAPVYDTAMQQFSDVFADAVKLRMRSDVPVGFTLSGGLDSSAVLQSAVAATESSGGRLRAFTSTYEPVDSIIVDERRWARLVASRYSRVDLEEVNADDDDWLNVLSRIVWHLDGPASAPAVFPLWRIMERARASRVPVLLEGQGADELLGGYTQYAALALRDLLSRHRVVAFKRDFQAYSRTFSARMLSLWLAREQMSFAIRLNRRRVGALGTMRTDFVHRFEARFSDEAPRTVDERLASDLTRDILPGLLQYGDAISMAHSIESRLPFLDYRVVEFVSSLPAEFKVGGGETKRLLRDHLRTVGLDAIANRRDKLGYPTPADAWLRSSGGATLKAILLANDATIRTYCRPERIERLIDYHASGRKGAGNHLYRLLTAELWLRCCISG